MSGISFEFNAMGGVQSASLKLPEGAVATTPLVLVAPALGIRASYYDTLCEALCEAGFGACAIDSPGHGASPLRASRQQDWGYGELLEHFGAASDALRGALPQGPQIMLGHSIGGQVALMLSGAEPERFSHVCVVASGSPCWRGWHGLEAARILASVSLCGPIARAMGYFPGDRLGFGGREARTLIRQWSSMALSGEYRFEGFDGEAMLRASGPPVLAICLRGDAYAPAEAMRHTLDKMSAREVTWQLWEDPPHGGNHNRWPSRPEPVAERLRHWWQSAPVTPA